MLPNGVARCRHYREQHETALAEPRHPANPRLGLREFPPRLLREAAFFTYRDVFGKHRALPNSRQERAPCGLCKQSGPQLGARVLGVR